MRQHELEFEDEFEAECEGEGECEFEGEFEATRLFPQIGSLAGPTGLQRSPAQRQTAIMAARAVMRPPVQLGAGPLVRAAGLSEFEWEGEDEALLNPARRAALAGPTMAHLGHAAARASSAAEAEAFLGALIPIAARLVPRLAPTVMRAAPGLIRGVANVGRTLLRSPATRPLVRAVPSIVRGTVANIARQVASGRPITPTTAVRTLAQQTYRTLATPQAASRAVRQTRALDRAYHQQAGGCQCR